MFVNLKIMTTALQLSQLIGQLTPENAAILETYAEFLLQQQYKKGESSLATSAIPDHLKTALKFKGKAKLPKTSTPKTEVYEQ